MKDFKRKASSSSIEKLKTHPKFPLIETFLETLTSSSREVQHIMIFVKCLINIYLVLVNASLSLFERGVQVLEYGIVEDEWLIKFKSCVTNTDQHLLKSCGNIEKIKSLICNLHKINKNF